MNFPIQEPIQVRVYMSTSGNDTNSGDSLTPIASFTHAINTLNQLTLNQSGEVFTEIVMYAGTYTQALSQGISQYQIGTKKLNVSIRGIGQVKLDGSTVSNISSGGGMIHLLGSKIAVRNIEILYSPANGVRFGYDYNGIEVNSHDILVEDVIVASTLGHGILLGKGALNTVNPLTLTPKAERFLVQRCEVKNAVNYNTPQTQWGSAIKAWNARHVNIRNCFVHDNSGEGIDFDDCDSVAVYSNSLKDNYANVYFDKVTNGWIYSNFIQNDQKKSAGILCAIEAFTGLITNHYIKNIVIVNNILFNTQGIHFWQGNYGANQQGYFQNIDIEHNTVIGHQTGSGSCLHFNYQTFLGQPVPNITFQNINATRNIISAPADSLSNGQLCASSLSPQIGMTASFNMYSSNQVPWYNSNSDVINSQMPGFVTSLSEITPCSTNPFFVFAAPSSGILVDYFLAPRNPLNTNVGAIEFSQGSGVNDQENSKAFLYPNPTHGILLVPSTLLEMEFDVFDMSGKKLHHDCIDASLQIDLQFLSDGWYQLKVGELHQKLLLSH